MTRNRDRRQVSEAIIKDVAAEDAAIIGEAFADTGVSLLPAKIAPDPCRPGRSVGARGGRRRRIRGAGTEGTTDDHHILP